uniref:Putative secreted protein n=1 Tax=Anopheles darlingi TaxID=43151 RepID=A0A2M4DF33_ANODA
MQHVLVVLVVLVVVVVAAVVQHSSLHWRLLDVGHKSKSKACSSQCVRVRAPRMTPIPVVLALGFSA